MGPPKAFKTGAVVGTYPKPLLYLGWDREGISVIPPAHIKPAQGEVAMDVTYEEVVHIKPGQVGEWVTKPMDQQPKVLSIDFTSADMANLSLEFKPPPNTAPFQLWVNDYNQMANFIRLGKPLPWRTVVFDSITGYEDVLMNHISAFNPSALDDARKWASQVGGKVRQTIITLTTWPCHVVFICHSALDKNETSGMVTELPNVFSSLRNDIGGLFSQFFYSVKVNGIPKIWPHDKMFVRGVGARWPSGLATEIGPTFQEIYGKEGLA